MIKCILPLLVTIVFVTAGCNRIGEKPPHANCEITRDLKHVRSSVPELNERDMNLGIGESIEICKSMSKITSVRHVGRVKEIRNARYRVYTEIETPELDARNRLLNLDDRQFFIEACNESSCVPGSVGRGFTVLNVSEIELSGVLSGIESLSSQIDDDFLAGTTCRRFTLENMSLARVDASQRGSSILSVTFKQRDGSSCEMSALINGNSYIVKSVGEVI